MLSFLGFWEKKEAEGSEKEAEGSEKEAEGSEERSRRK